MVQFGAGLELAAQCPHAPPPDGWRAWTDADGPIPDALKSRAQDMIASPSIDLGATESSPLPGVVALIRIEPQAWSRNAQGDLVEGCFRAAGIYLPDDTQSGANATPPSSPSSLSKTVGVLTAVSLVVGTIATLATWGSRK